MSVNDRCGCGCDALAFLGVCPLRSATTLSRRRASERSQAPARDHRAGATDEGDGRWTTERRPAARADTAPRTRSSVVRSRSRGLDSLSFVRSQCSLPLGVRLLSTHSHPPAAMMNRLQPLQTHQHQKSNSTSSVFATGTITEPNMGELVSSVSTMLHCQVSSESHHVALTGSFLFDRSPLCSLLFSHSPAR
jgi:hypothetical protein